MITWLPNNVEIPQGLDLNTGIECHQFPVNVFPVSIQNIISATSGALQFPVDFSAGSILYATSVAIGNSVKVRVKEAWQETACIYITLVGAPGTNKTHPLSFYTRPLEEHDARSFEQYKIAKSKFDYHLRLTEKQKAELGVAESISPPQWQKMLISDTTPEALAACHFQNLRGLGLCTDELASWYKNFDRYHKGSDEQFWLTNFNNKPIRVDRKKDEPIYIREPFISVAGTIQPAVVQDLARNRTANGFLDRILFVVPHDLRKEYWGNTQLDLKISEQWQEIIDRLISTKLLVTDNGCLLPEVITFSESAFTVLSRWQRTNTDRCNEEVALAGVYAKLEIYVIRLSLILHQLKKACGECNLQISVDTVEGAIKIAEYFKASAERIHSLLNISPLDCLPDNKRELYEALPPQFTTEDGVQLAASLRPPTPERTFKRFLGDTTYFKHAKRGLYEKRF